MQHCNKTRLFKDNTYYDCIRVELSGKSKAGRYEPTSEDTNFWISFSKLTLSLTFDVVELQKNVLILFWKKVESNK